MDVLSQQKPQTSTIVTTPSTQAFGDAAAIGTATDYADASHKHAMPTTADVVTAAWADPRMTWGLLLMGG